MLHSLQTRSISNEYSLLGRVCQVSGRTSYRVSQDQTPVSSEMGGGGSGGMRTGQPQNRSGKWRGIALIFAWLFVSFFK